MSAAQQKILKIGTRGSKLALWQAYFLQDQLRQVGTESELVVIKTKGDQIQHLGFDKMEGKGFFTKEIEDHLLRGDIDVAVHSMKDLPTAMPEGLAISAVSYRENPSDCLLINKMAFEAAKLLKVKENAIIGTSSARRKAQLLDFRSDFQLKDIRGNVPTRIQKLRERQFDAIMLAAAGIKRLEIDLSDFEVLHFDPREFVPAPAQGVLAFQVNEADKPTRRILHQIHDRAVADVVKVERKILKLLNGGCQMPVGIYCKQDQLNNYHVWATKAESWNSPLQSAQVSSSTSAGLAEKVVEALDAKVEMEPEVRH
ncbi:MAG: hydroxymethylbilane synthase [Bacteroidota bacterium]